MRLRLKKYPTTSFLIQCRVRYCSWWSPLVDCTFCVRIDCKHSYLTRISDCLCQVKINEAPFTCMQTTKTRSQKTTWLIPVVHCLNAVKQYVPPVHAICKLQFISLVQKPSLTLNEKCWSQPLYKGLYEKDKIKWLK